MFALCETLKWALPVAGGIYDQDPELVDKWIYIISERAQRERKDKEMSERKAKTKGHKGPVKGRPVAGRSR